MIGERPPFNELLTAAYMEKQSMGFHTDGERGLGPMVASLSMGSPAIMKFRKLEDKKTVVLTLVLRHVCLFILKLVGQQFTSIVCRESKLQSF
jgi:alkylated DNA repair dioxygenase AlkB